MNRLKLVHPDDLVIKNDIIIDIRREAEFAETGIIKNSIKLTFFDDYGQYDLLSWIKEFKKHVTKKEQKFVLVCAHAQRTDMLGNYLLNELEYKNTSHLEGGISLWLRLNKETV